VARSHPPTLITRTRTALREAGLIPRGGRVLVAVSGGPDSMALLHVLGLLRARHAFGLFAHGVDHGLRAAAAGELDVAEDFARRLEVPFTRSAVRVAPGGNLQARARAGRWEALRAAASRAGVDRIATGHHADDRDRIRPFYRARRTDIDAHVARHAVPHALDPSNHDPRFLRTRIRGELMPVLQALSPRIVEHLCDLADRSAPPGGDEGPSRPSR